MDLETIWFCQSAKIQLLTFSFLFFFAKNSTPTEDHTGSGTSSTFEKEQRWLCLPGTFPVGHGTGSGFASKGRTISGSICGVSQPWYRDTPQKKTWNGWKVATEMSMMWSFGDHLKVIKVHLVII